MGLDSTALLPTGESLLIYICIFHVLSNLLLIYICKLHWTLQPSYLLLQAPQVTRNNDEEESPATALVSPPLPPAVSLLPRVEYDQSRHTVFPHVGIDQSNGSIISTDREAEGSHASRALAVSMARLGLLFLGESLLIYICNFHVLSDLLLIYIYKLHWNRTGRLFPDSSILEGAPLCLPAAPPALGRQVNPF